MIKRERKSTQDNMSHPDPKYDPQQIQCYECGEYIHILDAHPHVTIDGIKSICESCKQELINDHIKSDYEEREI